MLKSQQSEEILGYKISVETTSSSVNNIIKWLNDFEDVKIFVCANPHSLVVAKEDPLFRNALHESDLVTPDGIGLVLASKILGGNIDRRVTGSDIFWGLSNKLNEIGGKSYFFLGSTKETLTAIEKKMSKEYPNIIFAGAYSPPYKSEFSEEDNNLMVDAINAAKPDILWVGMTAPKQEKWLQQHKHRLNVKFAGAVGAVFDFYVGNVKRSHPFFQNRGLEWLQRFMQEPRRLFKRNFVSSPLFLLQVFSQKFSLIRKNRR